MDGGCEISSDLSSSPSGTTNHGAGMGWCYSDLNDEPPGGCTASPADCYLMCLDWKGDKLVAIDWWDDGECYCQDDCGCIAEIGDMDAYLITRDSAVPALPGECSGAVVDDDDGEGD